MIKDYLRLVRFRDSLFAGFAVLIAGILSSELTQFEYSAGFVSIVFLAMATFAINDYYDYRNDKENNRNDRPLVKGTIKRGSALGMGIFLYIASFYAALMIGVPAAVFVLIHAPLFYLYSYTLKRKLFIKNILVAYGFSAAIIFGSILTDMVLEPIIIYFAVMAFIVGLAFEIMIDIADMRGDRKAGVRTVPVVFSARTAAIMSILLFVVIMVMDPLPYFFDIDARLYGDLVFLLLILIPVFAYIFISLSLLRNRSKNNVFRLREKTMRVMQFGTLVYLLGVIA